MTKEKVYVYTDGSCVLIPIKKRPKGHNGSWEKTGYGGWGAVIDYGYDQKEDIYGSVLKTTCQRMEVQAVIEVLEYLLNDDRDIVILSDSSYVVDGINKKWALNWEKNNWRTPKGRKRKNRDLWEKVLDLLDDCFGNITFEHVKGHSGVPGNDRAHKLAKDAAQRLAISKRPEFRP